MAKRNHDKARESVDETLRDMFERGGPMLPSFPQRNPRVHVKQTRAQIDSHYARISELLAQEHARLVKTWNQ